MSIPEEIERREMRLAAIAEAKAKIEARAQERFEREQAEHQGEDGGPRRAGEAHRQEARGRPPEPPTGGVNEQRPDQSDG